MTEAREQRHPPVSARQGDDYGGSSGAIQYHYDISRAFYELWLDPAMTYSCALWEDGDDLSSAQDRKNQYHLAQARADSAHSILDIGCGWGGLMRAAAERCDLQRMVGLTLSEDQAAYVRQLNIPNAQVRLENWTQHEPETPYDAIISIGAFEHFTKPEDSDEGKIATYRDFFHRCHKWLNPGGRVSLQTIAFGSMKRDEASEFINNEIFPASDLPRMRDIAAAADGIVEIERVRNDRLDYAKTFEKWAMNLRANKRRAEELVGSEVTHRYLKYLTQSSMGFYLGKIVLYRLTLRPISTDWASMATR